MVNPKAKIQSTVAGGKDQISRRVCSFQSEKNSKKLIANSRGRRMQKIRENVGDEIAIQTYTV